MRMFLNPITGQKKVINRFILSIGIFFSLFLLFNGCAKDPDNIGRDLLPASDDIVIRIDSSTSISSKSITGKRILSSLNELYVLGSLKDSIFGYGTASILTQFHPKVLMSADSLRSVDSLVLYLDPAGRYGDTLSPLTLRVYELNQKMILDTGYYSDMNPAEYYDPLNELGQATFKPGDSLIIVKLSDPGFISRFQALSDTVFKDYGDFMNEFYGLYLSVDKVSENGGYLYFNMSSLDTRLTMYFNGDTTTSKSYEMGFTSIAAKANIFSHDYVGFPVNGILDLPENADSLVYIEGLAGVSGRIRFPDLEEWKQKGLITINKAELILPIDTVIYPQLSTDNFPPRLLLFSLKDDESYDYLYDYLIDQNGNYFNGSIDTILNAYVFNIGLHLQSFIDKKIENSDLVLVSRRSNSTADRVILKGATSEESPMILKVIYTELY